MGVDLASAVASDAFVVRMAIAPAVLALLGKRAWWLPRNLDRVLPTDHESGLTAQSIPKHPPSAGSDIPCRLTSSGMGCLIRH